MDIGPSPIIVSADTQPREFLVNLMRNPDLPLGFRFRAAVLALPYCHPKFAPLGQKALADLVESAADRDGDWVGLLQ